MLNLSIKLRFVLNGPEITFAALGDALAGGRGARGGRVALFARLVAQGDHERGHAVVGEAAVGRDEKRRRETALGDWRPRRRGECWTWCWRVARGHTRSAGRFEWPVDADWCVVIEWHWEAV